MLIMVIMMITIWLHSGYSDIILQGEKAPLPPTWSAPASDISRLQGAEP